LGLLNSEIWILKCVKQAFLVHGLIICHLEYSRGVECVKTINTSGKNTKYSYKGIKRINLVFLKNEIPQIANEW